MWTTLELITSLENVIPSGEIKVDEDERVIKYNMKFHNTRACSTRGKYITRNSTIIEFVPHAEKYRTKFHKYQNVYIKDSFKKAGEKN